MTKASHRALAIEATAVGLVSAAIITASDRVLLMNALVPAVIVARTAAVLALPRVERGTTVPVELALLGVCTVLGGGNDWLSVVHHGVYDYDVPVLFPELGAIPLWMLLYWGLVLRAIATLTRWRGLDPPERPRDAVRLGPWRRESAPLKLTLQLALVVGTRQAIYRFHHDPILSWLPFAAALALYVLLFGLDRHERRLALLFLVGGPLVEVLYIQLGGLHRYPLGWLGGVPLWIALWWVLAVWVWKDLTRLPDRWRAARRRGYAWNRGLRERAEPSGGARG